MAVDPLLTARTQGFTLGRAVRCTISPDGRHVLFLRTGGGEDPVRRLWRYDVGTGAERLLADPLTLTAGGEPSPQEHTRRQRARDRSSGIAGYAADTGLRTVAFALDDRLFTVDAATGEVTERPARQPVTDPRPSPDGRAIGYVSDGALRVLDTAGDRPLAEPDGPDVTYGLAEHEAAESMHRQRGFWWSPDGARLAVARVDNTPVQTWQLADPGRPDAPPRTLRYPYAGTPNAAVTLWIVGLDGSRVPVDLAGAEYLVDVVWDGTALLAVVQNRPQTVLRILAVDPDNGHTTLRQETFDPAWTTIVPGVPVHTAGGVLIATVDDGDTRRLTADGRPVTPPGLQVAEILGVDGTTVLFAGSEEPTERHLWTWSEAGVVRRTHVPGWHGGALAGGTLVQVSDTPDGASVTVAGRTPADHSTPPPVRPRVELIRAGARALRTAVLFPTGHEPGRARLPVLLDPYGGPAAQRAIAAQGRFHVSQWFADQGFAVLVADGRGTPGRGPRWERTIHRDRTDVVLQDQVEALHAAAERYPDLDLGRVAIRGWSAGGTLAALAVLRRPDVFHAAVAGAAVTDQLLYSTHWQERYLGDPRADPEPYARNSLLADAPRLRRPLMLVHGLLDDNVHPVHTIRLSAALFTAGRPHTVLPLSGAGHMIPAAQMTANLQLAEARFLIDALHPVRELA